MRFTAVLSKARPGRAPEKEPVPFQEILPLKLKPTVSGKGDNTTEVCCLYEMSVLLACFKDNEFNQATCSKEIEAFKNCYTKHIATSKGRKEREAKGILTPGERKLSAKQTNTLLKKYPNIK